MNFRNFFPIMREKWNNRNNHFYIYIPSRTGMALIAKENMSKYDLNEFKKSINLLDVDTLKELEENTKKEQIIEGKEKIEFEQKKEQETEIKEKVII